jgi:hypothetical protein
LRQIKWLQKSNQAVCKSSISTRPIMNPMFHIAGGCAEEASWGGFFGSNFRGKLCLK